MKRIVASYDPSELLDLSFHIARYKFAARMLSSNCKRVLDCGCGTGYGAAFLANQGFNITATDYNSSELLGYWEAYQNVQFLTYERFVESDFVFDAVVSLEVIEHVPLDKLSQYFSLIKKVLVPGGFFICSTPRYLPFEERSRNRQLEHTYEYTFDEFEEVLREKFSKVITFSQNDSVISDQSPANAWNYIALCIDS